MRWQPPDIADAVAAGLTRKAQEDDAEHAVYGFDALDELGLHPLINRALSEGGYGVWPEQRYPGHWHKAKRSEGLRCDLVLTPDGHPLRDEAVKDTLFDTGEAVDAQMAYWLEVKTVAQYETGGAFRRYSAELLSPVMNDVKKIWSDGVIQHGGLLIILFTVLVPTILIAGAVADQGLQLYQSLQSGDVDPGAKIGDDGVFAAEAGLPSLGKAQIPQNRRGAI